MTAGRRLVSGSYQIFDALLRFDTSSIPDDATITAATLKLFVTAKANSNGRNLVADWYDTANWPIDAADYQQDPAGTALTGSPLGSATVSAMNSFTLTNLSSVSLTGQTGLRLQIDGGQPTGDNYLQLASFDSTTNPKPQLVITYTVGG
jgi:hypothetical protein